MNKMPLALGAAIAVGALVLPPALAAPPGPTSASVARDAFDASPIVLTGAQFPDWSAGPELTARAPQVPTDPGSFDSQQYQPGPIRSDCYEASPAPDVNGRVDPTHGDHNCYQSSQLPVRTMPGRTGVPPASLRGYRWDGHRFVQIPFQVDTKWQHYISNNASGFGVYSGVDETTTYTFDREGFRFTTNAPFDPANPSVVCQARPAGGITTTPDPNQGLIDTDELAFMARDAGRSAPAGTALPAGVVAARQVAVTNPADGATSYVYVMESAPRGADWAIAPAFTAANSPYVRYQPDANADTFVYSKSSYSSYGNAPAGPVCTPAGEPVVGKGFKRLANGQLALDPATYVQRRPLDTATITTPRYRFREDGRWLMDDLGVSADGRGLTKADYGPSIIDRFKGRAFQQSPGGQTPCCGYEDEQNNWGGSSVLMGEKVGPVRAIRETWGADSGTNVTRTDIFYADQIDHAYELRVHPIPPLDGIYTQWDMAAGRVTTYYNPYNPTGVPIAGINPVLYGDTNAHIGPDGIAYSSNDTVGRMIGGVTGGKPVSVGSPNNSTCTSSACVYGSFNVPDATFSGVASEALSWEEMTGPAGTLVERYGASQVTPLGTALASVEAQPYYVDDACFDDGTGADPGPHLARRSPNEPTTWGYTAAGVPVAPAPPGAPPHERRCWNHNPDGTPYNIPGTAPFDPARAAQRPDPPPDRGFSPQGDIRYYQGDVGTHGLHLVLNAESDNAGLTTPVDEIDAVDHQIVLPGNEPNVGAAYTARYTVPFVIGVEAWPGPSAPVPGATPVPAVAVAPH